MYSNIKIYAFFFMILSFAPLLISAGGSQQLLQDHYDKTCPGLQDKVSWGVWNATQYDPRMPASLIRLHFHDCFVNGCDASVLLDVPNGEQSADANKYSARGFEVIDNIKKDVENLCPRIVSCADILALAARASVKLAITHHGWPEKDKSQPWQVGLGRMDGLISDRAEANRRIPSPADSLETIIDKFHIKGLDLADLVALSGAHTIGFSHCSSFNDRIYPAKDRLMNQNQFSVLQNFCRHNDTNLAPLDSTSPNNFDNRYYTDLVTNAGVLKSDQALWTYNMTKLMVAKYSKNQKYFLPDFGASMVKMGNIDVIPAGGGGGRGGQIRRKCGSTN